jgi:asparagine synthetase B (glutamine-hydrolysing)
VQSLGDVTMGWVWPDVQASFADGGEGIGVALDGEVHNWAELADGAASLAHALQIAYHRDGPGFVAKIDGPFALAIAGPRGLLLARDLVGKSPPTASTGTRSASLRR